MPSSLRRGPTPDLIFRVTTSKGVVTKKAPSIKTIMQRLAMRPPQLPAVLLVENMSASLIKEGKTVGEVIYDREKDGELR